ncbi:MAG: hypothetical protein KGZ69_13535 [Methylomonas sp.]|nr:hypothetical protein [Methylomonas sp.]
MSENVTWIEDAVNVSISALQMDDTGIEAPQLVLELVHQSGHLTRLNISARAASNLSEVLAVLLQSEHSPLRRGSNEQSTDH